MGVAVVRDQGATSLVTSKFDFVRVDFVERRDDGLAIDLNDGLVGAYGRSFELRLHISGWLNVSTRLVELDTMRALRVVPLLRMKVNVIPTRVTATEVVVIGQLSLTAAHDSTAHPHHLLRKGELLTVKDQGALVVVESVLGLPALVTCSLHLFDCPGEVLVVLRQVVVDVLLVGADARAVYMDPLIERIDVVAEVADGGLEGLESDKKFRLDLDSLLVVVLVPDLLALVELVDLLVEVGAGKLFTVLLGIVRCPVIRANGKARLPTMPVLFNNHCLCVAGNGGKSG